MYAKLRSTIFKSECFLKGLPLQHAMTSKHAPTVDHSVPCGFRALSAFSPSLLPQLAAQQHKATANCSIVVITAVFGCRDKLHQPLHAPGKLLSGCYFAFVDSCYARIKALNVSEIVAAHDGVWTVVEVKESLGMPFPGSSRRNSRIPKMLPHQLFPHAHYAVWVDSKLRLHIDPEVAIQRFLINASAFFAGSLHSIHSMQPCFQRMLEMCHVHAVISYM